MKKLIMTGLITIIIPLFVACGTAVSTEKPATVPSEITSNLIQEEEKTVHTKVQLTHKTADGYVIPLGKVYIVCVITDVGMVGCGAFDVMALDSFGCPAVKVKSAIGGSIATIDDLQKGIVKQVNAEAAKLGIREGMTGREALDLM